MTLVKKMVLLASMALVALALVGPASASAETWSFNGVKLKAGEKVTQAYTGTFKWGPNGMSCPANLKIEAEATAAKFTQFELEAESCIGEGSKAECTLKAQSNNLASGWNISATSLPGLITSGSGNLEISETLGPWFEESGEWCPSFTKVFKFSSMKFSPTLNAEGGITSFSISGVDQFGVSYSFGPFKPTGSASLGLLK